MNTGGAGCGKRNYQLDNNNNYYYCTVLTRFAVPMTVLGMVVPASKKQDHNLEVLLALALLPSAEVEAAAKGDFGQLKTGAPVTVVPGWLKSG